MYMWSGNVITENNAFSVSVDSFNGLLYSLQLLIVEIQMNRFVRWDRFIFNFSTRIALPFLALP